MQNNTNKKNVSGNKRKHQRDQKTNQKNKKGLIQTGNFGSFLAGQEWSDDTLLGQMPASNDPRLPDLECIAQFLADYRAMSTLHLHARQTNNSPTNGGSSNNDNSPCHSHASTAYYIPVIQDFALTQKDRQSAGLRTNTSRETSEGMSQVVESHSKALETAMEHVDPFQSTLFLHESSNDSQDHLVPTDQTLCQWHSVLVANTTGSPGKNSNNAASIPKAQSCFRKSRAKAGKTVFCPPQEIPNEFQQFRSAMIRYCHRWESKILMSERKRSGSITSAVDSAAATELANQMTQQKHTSIYHALGVAAMYLFGIVDIHMYSDGNGRMSRIGANWMLKRLLGWPFTITLVANPQQRREYISALQHAVTCIQLARSQQQQQMPICLSESVFRPLITLLLDRMANAVRECQRKLTEKSQLTRAAEEARIARKVREETASGRCVICLDDNPNIATLCCGQGVHLNCIAEWLANNSNCVYCRGPLPQLRIQRPPPPEEDEEEEAEDAGGVIVSEIQNVLSMPDANMAAATAAAVSRLTSNPAVLNMIRQSLQDQALDDAEDTFSVHSTTTMTFSSDSEEDDDDDEDDAEDDNSDDDMSNSSTSMICVNGVCLRRTQTWCPHGMCSRCCAGSGVYCSFHQGYMSPVEEEDDRTILLDSNGHYDPNATNHREQRLTQNAGNDTTTFLGNDDDDEEDTTTWSSAPRPNQRAVCCSTGDCNNRPAADCQNHMCGRCCVLFGQYNCQRHNTGSYAH